MGSIPIWAAVSIELEIEEYNYWECFKSVKDLALVLPVGHPKRKAVETQLEECRLKIQKIKQEESGNKK